MALSAIDPGFNQEEHAKSIVEETRELFERYTTDAQEWRVQSQENREFRYGRHWTEAQYDELTSMGHSPITVDRLGPAIESVKSIMTSNRPGFQCIPQENSDAKTAEALSRMLTYCYDISEGAVHVAKFIDDFLTIGMGVFYAYQDPLADMGKGEVMFQAVDPDKVSISSSSRNHKCTDSENIILSYMFTKKQAAQMKPQYKGAIEGAVSDQDFNLPSTGNRDGLNKLFFEVDIANATLNDDDYVRGYMRYKNVRVMYTRVFEKWSGEERIYREDEYQKYLQQPAYIYKGTPFTDPQEMAKIDQAIKDIIERQVELVANITEQHQQAILDIAAERAETMKGLDEALANDALEQERYDAEVNRLETAVQGKLEQAEENFESSVQAITNPEQPESVTIAELVQAGFIEEVSYPEERVMEYQIIGDQLVSEREMTLDEYPLIIAMNHHLGTPYPIGDVGLAKGNQEYINKLRSLIVAHTTSSVGSALLVGEGAVTDIEEMERKLARPGTKIIEIDFEEGQPIPMAPMPLANELYKTEADAKADIDHLLGVYELMLGNPSAAPDTHKATLSIDEYGQRRIRAKMMSIEDGLSRLGNVLIKLMQELYHTHKFMRILQPNGEMSEFSVNENLYDDFGKIIGRLNDITIGKYDCKVKSMSMLPDNRYGKMDWYLNLFDRKIIDGEEVLRKSGDFDIDGILERQGEKQKMQQALGKQQEEIKDLKGDMQTKDRQIQSLTNKVETEKFKATLKIEAERAKLAGELYERRLADAARYKQRNDADSKRTQRSKGKKNANRS